MLDTPVMHAGLQSRRNEKQLIFLLVLKAVELNSLGGRKCSVVVAFNKLVLTCFFMAGVAARLQASLVHT